MEINDLEIKRALDEAEADMSRRKRAENLQGFDAAFRASGLDVAGPPKEEYDYENAFLENSGFNTSQAGGIDLPNRFIKNSVIAGRTPDGEMLAKWNDPDGFAKAGWEGFNKSYTNTETGPPAEMATPLVALALAHRQNGGAAEDFDVPIAPEVKQRVMETANGVLRIKQLQQEVKQRDAQPQAEEEGGEGTSLTIEDLVQDPEWLSDSRLVAEYMEAEIEDDQELTSKGIQEIALRKANSFKMAETLYEIETGIMPENVRDAMARMLMKYDQLPDYDWDVVKGNMAGIVLDIPVSLFAGMGLARLAALGVGKSASLRYLLQKLTAHQVARAAGAGTVAGAAEGGIYAGGEEAVRQGIAGDGYDMGDILTVGAFGSLAGGVLGGSMGAILSEPGRDGMKRAWRSVADNWANMELTAPGTPGAQRGSISGKAIPNKKSRRMPTLRDFGIENAYAGKGGFYSRLEEGINTRLDMLGKKKKEFPVQQILDDIPKWLRAPKGHEGFSQAELDNTGLVEFLTNELASDPKKTISRERLGDYLYATRPRINANLSSVSDYSAPGKQSFKMSLDPEIIRKVHGRRAMMDRFFEHREEYEEVDMSAAKAAADTYIAQAQKWVDYVNNMDVMDDTKLYPEDALLAPTDLKAPPAMYANDVDYGTQVAKYVSRMEKAAMAGKPFTEAPPEIKPRTRKVNILKDRVDGTEHRLSESEMLMYMDTQIKPRLSRLTDDEVTQLVLDHDAAQIMAPVRWGGTHNPMRASYALVKGESIADYREMRLYLAYDEATNAADIALNRMGKNVDELTAREKDRVADIQKWAARPADAVTDQRAHWPGERNTMATVRMQTLQLGDGNSVLAVNEMQSDTSREAYRAHPQRVVTHAMRRATKEEFAERAHQHGIPNEDISSILDRLMDNYDPAQPGDTPLYEEFGGSGDEEVFNNFINPNEIASVFRNERFNPEGAEQWTKAMADPEFATVVKRLFQDSPAPEPYGQAYLPMEAWQNNTINRLLQLATKEGHAAVAFPVDADMITHIENWPADAIHNKDHPQHAKLMGVVRSAQQLEQRIIRRDKKMLKRWGVTITKEPVFHEGTNYGTMLVLRIDPSKAQKGDKAVYGAGALALPGGGVEFLEDDSE